MAKTPNTNTAQTAHPVYDHGTGQYPIKPYQQVQAGDNLLSLDSNNDGAQGYSYFDISSAYAGAFIPNTGAVIGDIQGAFYDDYGAIGMSETAGRMFVTGQQQGSNPSGAAIAEIEIPALVTGTNVFNLNVANTVQPYSMAHSLDALDFPRLMGIYAVDGQVICGGTNYYDGA